VLTVGNNELAVRDDDNASSEVAEGGHVWEGPRKLTWMDRQVIRQAGSGLPGRLGSLKHHECQYIL
jgi:hypothetical protein